MGATVHFAYVLAIVVGTALAPSIAAAEPKCPEMIVGTHELEAVLDQTLGDLRAFVDQRSVTIDPGSKACYLRISIATSALSQFGAACRLTGCSTILHGPKSLALGEFDFTGCEGLFDGVGLSRHVPSTYVDETARIRQQCTSDDFAIDSVSAARVAGEPRLRFRFRWEPARQ